MSARQSSAVDQALAWLKADKARTRYAAAKKFGLALSTIYRATGRNGLTFPKSKRGRS